MDPTAPLPGTPATQAPPGDPKALGPLLLRHPFGTKGPRSSSSTDLQTPQLPSPGPDTQGHSGIPALSTDSRSSPGPPGTQDPQILLLQGLPAPRDTRCPLPWDPLHPGIPAPFLLPHIAPIPTPPCTPPTVGQPGDEADPVEWHSPGTGVMRCLLGGTSWWAGRRAGERTAVRENHRSSPKLYPPLPAAPHQPRSPGARLYLSGSSGHRRLPAPGASPCCQTDPGLWGPPHSCRGRERTGCGSLWDGV